MVSMANESAMFGFLTFWCKSSFCKGRKFLDSALS